MKINIIKQLAETYPEATLNHAAEQIENGDTPNIPIEGDDDAEKLSHALGAAWVLEQVNQNQTDIRTELRNFAARVRESIG